MARHQSVKMGGRGKAEIGKVESRNGESRNGESRKVESRNGEPQGYPPAPAIALSRAPDFRVFPLELELSTRTAALRLILQSSSLLILRKKKFDGAHQCIDSAKYDQFRTILAG